VVEIFVIFKTEIAFGLAYGPMNLSVETPMT
jgi:hypothetical protein